jgi:hypothetical protein
MPQRDSNPGSQQQSGQDLRLRPRGYQNRHFIDLLIIQFRGELRAEMLVL